MSAVTGTFDGKPDRSAGALNPAMPQSRIYQRSVSGYWRNVKYGVLAVIFAGYYLTPWLRWSRGGTAPDQAVLVSFPGARAYVFGFEFWPQDLFLLVLVLLAAAFGLFFTNTIVGRVWCGFTCPQTLWSDVFMITERLLEGDRNARMRRDAQGATLSDRIRTIGKHLAWFAIALATSLTFVSYFTDAPSLWHGVFTATASPVAYVFVALFTATTYLLAAYAREKVCLHMCPWPRFQSAMLDIDTKLVTYQSWRGEPRGKGKPAASGAGFGDCVDCGLCVAVCPTGVDIRNGLQFGCIGCALCADACDGVMAKLHRSSGLIAFASQREIDAAMRHAPAPRPQVFTRVRLMGFGALFAVALGAIAVLLFTHSALDFTVDPERSPPFVTLSDGSIRNIYRMRISDRGTGADSLRLQAEGLAAYEITLVQGVTERRGGLIDLDRARPDETYRLMITVPPQAVPEGRHPIRLRLADPASGDTRAEIGTYFWGPEKLGPAR